MKKQAVCQYCGEVFEDNKDNDYKKECAKHEVSHLDLENKFTLNLKESLNQLDQKYESESKVLNVSIHVCYDSYYGHDVTYEFEVYNSKLNKMIKSEIEVFYENKEEIPTVQTINGLLEHHFFIPTINKKYEGKFCFEDYCGGHGADDYKVGDSYMRTIYEAFKDKKVRIEVID